MQEPRERERPARKLLAPLLLLALAGCRAESALAPGPPRAGELRGGQVARFAVDLERGEAARIAVEQRGVDLALAVIAPSGRTVARRDAPTTPQGPEPLTVLAQESGRYVLELSAVREDAVPGRFTVALQERGPAGPEDRGRIAAEETLSEAGRRHWQDDLLGAYAAYVRAERQLLRLGEERLATWAALNRGEIEMEGEEAYRGLARLDAALAAFRRLGDRGGEAVTLGSLTYAHASFGDREAQLATGREALALQRALGDLYGEATTLHNQGYFYESLGELEDAARLYREALAVMRRAADRYGEAYTLTNLGRVLGDQGRPRAALSVLEQALALRRQVGDRRGEGRTLARLGAIEAQLGRRDAARACYRRAAELLAAASELRAGSEVARLAGELAAEEGRVDLARRHYEAARDLAVKVRDPVAEAESLYGLARVARQEGQRAECLAILGRAIGLVEALRLKVAGEEERGAYLASVHRLYELAIEVEMELAAEEPARREAALAWSQRARSRGLLESFAGPNPSVLSVATIQRQLLDEPAEPQGETALLQYALGEERSFLWAISREDFASFELPGRVVLEQAAGEVHRLVTARNRVVPFELPAERRQRIAAADAALPAALARLGKLVLGPLWETGRLPRLARRLAIVTDGALGSVPFAALPGPDGRPLVVSREVITLPSAAVAAALRRPRTAERQRRATRTLAVVADPVFSVADPRLPAPAPAAAPALPRLPATRREALAVASLVPRGERLVALDFAAGRGLATSGELGRYRILHLATHALVNDRDPRLSGVVLSLVDARGRPQDGVLRLEEIERLELAADLVVLSACRTALGRNLRGEGLLGLTRAFFNAGAKRVVATLWEAEDEATASLMADFYRAHLARGLSPGAALRLAQRKMLEDPHRPQWRAPYYWAGFVLEGEWR